MKDLIDRFLDSLEYQNNKEETYVAPQPTSFFRDDWKPPKYGFMAERHNPNPRIHDPNAFEVGDKVRIVDCAKDNEGGWTTTWHPEMYKNIGKYGIIRNNQNFIGYRVQGEELDSNSLFSASGFYYPSFVLRKVENNG